jgi:hypothetical protein
MEQHVYLECRFIYDWQDEEKILDNFSSEDTHFTSKKGNSEKKLSLTRIDTVYSNR